MGGLADMTYISWFHELGEHDLARAGGKGANLGELSRAGLPVPPGFVITTPAYNAFVASAGFQDEVVRLASETQGGDMVAFETASTRISALFTGAAMPDDVANEIRTAYDELAGKQGTAVAVRSSATAEDLPGASFAGQ
jgi:pyruvate,water dikinase